MAVFFGIGRRGGQWETNPGPRGRYIKEGCPKAALFYVPFFLSTLRLRLDKICGEVAVAGIRQQRDDGLARIFRAGRQLYRRR